MEVGVFVFVQVRFPMVLLRALLAEEHGLFVQTLMTLELFPGGKCFPAIFALVSLLFVLVLLHVFVESSVPLEFAGAFLATVHKCMSHRGRLLLGLLLPQDMWHDFHIFDV